MPCFANLNLSPAAPPGAHLSFYWTMNEGGTADRVDSTTNALHWPTQFGAAAVAGLFGNAIGMNNPVLINQDPGLGIFSTAAIQIIQANSKGISVFFWVKKLTTKFDVLFTMDTSNVAHTNRLIVAGGPFDGTPGSGVTIDHTNDTNDVFAATPNLNFVIGAWHFVVGTYDKVAQTINVYIDGALQATIADAFVYPDLTNTNMTMVNTDFGAVTQGAIDELGLCLNGALTPAQVTSLYNGGAGVTWPAVSAIVPFP